MTTGSGTGPRKARSMARKSGVKRPGATLPSRSTMPDDTDCPSTGTSLRPITTNIEASVASRSGIRSTTMSSAFTAPISAPASSTSAIAMPPTCA